MNIPTQDWHIHEWLGNIENRYTEYLLFNSSERVRSLSSNMVMVEECPKIVLGHV